MITFYYGSGSSYAWRVWLALEHKHLTYDFKLLSFSSGDTRKPEFLALNPRGKVPTIVDDGFVLYESAAIIEYLEEKYPAPRYPALFPASLHERATARRVIREIDAYLGAALEELVSAVLFTPQEQWSNERIMRARDGITQELDVFEQRLGNEYLLGALSAADYALYTDIALALRCGRKKADLYIEHAVGPKLTDWMHRIERLPYFETTYPPHWRQS